MPLICSINIALTDVRRATTEYLVKIKRILAFALAVLGACPGLDSLAQANPVAGKATGEIAEAAKKFLATLEDSQRGKVIFDSKDEAQRKRWSNLPTGIFRRAGLRMGDLTQPQRDAVLGVLAAALSPQGYEKVLQIVEGDEVLRKTDSSGRL